MVRKTAIFCECGTFIGYEEDFRFRYIPSKGIICPKCKRLVIAAPDFDKTWEGTSEEKLFDVMNGFQKYYKELTLDERDDYPDFEGMIKEHLGFIPIKKHKDIYGEYKRYKKKADKAIDIAVDLATAYRREGRVEIAKLEVKYYEMVDTLG